MFPKELIELFLLNFTFVVENLSYGKLKIKFVKLASLKTLKNI